MTTHFTRFYFHDDMKVFSCTHCGQLLYFENDRCEQCGYPLGFIARTLQLVPLTEQEMDDTLFITNKNPLAIAIVPITNMACAIG